MSARGYKPNDSSSDNVTDISISDSSNAEGEFNEFFDKAFSSKKEIIRASSEYSEAVGRTHKVLRSNRERLYFGCIQEPCSFQLRFQLRNKISKPKYIPHDCVEQYVVRNKTPKEILGLNEVLEWSAWEGREMNTSGLRRLLSSNGIKTDYNTLFRVVKKLTAELFADSKKQFRLLESYCNALRHNGHQVWFETKQDVEIISFSRLAIIKWEDLQAFAFYCQRGIQ